MAEDSTVKKLIETNVMLQHKMADLLIAMKETNTGLNNLVTMFSEAAAQIKTGKYDDPLVGKLNDLLEQNKNLAKGLIMLEEYIRTKKESAATQFRHPSNEF